MDAQKVALVALAGAFVAMKVINGIIKAYETYNKIVEAATIIQGAFQCYNGCQPICILWNSNRRCRCWSSLFLYSNRNR